MGYKRRQKDLERLERKERYSRMKRNPIAKDLHSPKYSQKVVESKSKYTRNSSKKYTKQYLEELHSEDSKDD